jgi:hypothetical protein
VVSAGVHSEGADGGGWLIGRRMGGGGGGNRCTKLAPWVDQYKMCACKVTRLGIAPGPVGAREVEDGLLRRAGTTTQARGRLKPGRMRGGERSGY